MLAEAIIVYRSRGEQARDEFFYDVLPQLIADHPVGFLVTGAIIIGLLIWIAKSNKY